MSQTSWCTTILTLVATITINYTITTIQTGDGVMVIIAYGLNGVMSTQQCVWERRKSGHCLIVVILGNWSLTEGGSELSGVFWCTGLTHTRSSKLSLLL